MTKRQLETVARIENLSGLPTNATALGRNCITMEVPDTNDLFVSAFVATIERVCNQYGIGTVKSGGYKRITIRLS